MLTPLLLLPTLLVQPEEGRGLLCVILGEREPEPEVWESWEPSSYMDTLIESA